MIQIQHYPLDSTNIEQEFQLKGLLKVIGITMINKTTPGAVIVVNTADNLKRTCYLYLLKENQDAGVLLRKPKYIGDVKGYYLFFGNIRPEPRIKL